MVAGVTEVGGVVDHEGRWFRSLRAMCRHWGVAISTLRNRVERGVPLGRALTEPAQGCIPARDHTGRDFPSMAAMAEAWGRDPAVVRRRLDWGWDVGSALTRPEGRGHARPTRDHEGRWFPTQGAMAKAWGLRPGTLSYRLRCGLSVRQALTAPCRGHGARPPRPTQEELLRSLSGGSALARRVIAESAVPREVIIERLARGWNLRDATSLPARMGLSGPGHAKGGKQ